MGNGAKEDAIAGAEKAFDASNAGEPGPGRVISEEEKKGVSSTDMNPDSPQGVGVSETANAEEIAAKNDEQGRETIGEQGPTRRPVGTSSEEDSTGVDP